MKCSCKDTNCKNFIRIEPSQDSAVIWVENNITASIMMYADANALISIIGEARRALAEIETKAGIGR